MFLINIANPWVLLLALALTVGFIYIGKEAKTAYVLLVPLAAFDILLIMHCIQLAMLSSQYAHMYQTIARCLAVDFVMILLSYISYLWVDGIEAKAKKKKSIDDSLEWFWKNV